VTSLDELRGLIDSVDRRILERLRAAEPPLDADTVVCRMRPVNATTKPELDELRRGIDAMDQQILKLVHERVRLVMLVGEYKRERNMAVYDPDREREVLDRLCAAAEPPLDKGTVRRIFERLIDESRRIEQRHIDK
jgi:chorismate mutase